MARRRQRRGGLRTFAAGTTAAAVLLLQLLLLLTFSTSTVDARHDASGSSSSIARGSFRHGGSSSSRAASSGPFRAARATQEEATTVAATTAREAIRQTRGGAASKPPAAKGKAAVAAAATPAAGAIAAPTLPTALSGAVLMALLEQSVKTFFKKQEISFPAPLASCLLLLVFLLLLEPLNAGMAAALANYLAPGAALLAKWLPVFFVPGLAMLPLAPRVGGPAEVRAHEARGNVVFCRCMQEWVYYPDRPWI
jgi:hypothetical protein